MTLIRLYRRAGRPSGFSVIGHSGSAPSGEDIVCAGISAVALTAINALESVAGIHTNPCVKEGVLSIRLPAGLSPRQREAARIILLSVEVGFHSIEETYPRYVRVSQQK